MIRFVDLRHAGVGGRFAYFDTVTDRFIEANGTHVWETCQALSEPFSF